MARRMKDFTDEVLIQKFEQLDKKMDSKMHYQAASSASDLNFSWLDHVEEACPYIDNIVRKPRVILVSDANVEKVEKAKKITVESVKHLARHTNYIDDYDNMSDEVKISNVLDVRNEESFNTYENRFVYTLINHIQIFILKQEKILDEFEAVNDKELEYKSDTVVNGEKVLIEMKVTSKKVFNGEDDDEFAKQIEDIRRRLKRIKQYMSIWNSSMFMKDLTKTKVPAVKPPIKKTNLILRNPNFQMATKLWEYIIRYNDDSENENENLDNNGNDILINILDGAFSDSYAVLDIICDSKRAQKENLRKHAVVIVNKLISRAVSLLLDAGIEVSDKEIMQLIGEELHKEKTKKLRGNGEVKEMFKSALSDYLDQTQNYL